MNEKKARELSKIRMKVVIGHKVLNLEELTNVGCLNKDLAEVICDS